jgi:NAD(P)-dependent dehydrogenase (short-subunit alcohol dehydrogenase family)
LAIVRGFLEAGATVTLCSRKQENVDKAVEELADVAANLQAVVAHVGKLDQLERLVANAEERFGDVDLLVNNAGTNPYYGPIVDSEDAAWDKTMEVNLRGPYVLSKLVARKMVVNGGGSIVNIASIAGITATPLQGIYSVTKAGLIMLTKVMARELGRDGVRVNCICPGVIKTKLSSALWSDPEAEKQAASLKALGRIGTTDELVGAAIYFACDASSFTTGAVLQIDGGMVL